MRTVILGGTDEVKEWTGAPEGAMIDDRLDDVAINETSPIRRQMQRPAIDEFPEAVEVERLFRIIETAVDRIKRRSLVSLVCQIFYEGVLHLRRDVEVRIKALIPEDSGVDSADDLEFRDPASPANHVYAQRAQRPCLSVFGPQRQLYTRRKSESNGRIERRFRMKEYNVGQEPF